MPIKFSGEKVSVSFSHGKRSMKVKLKENNSVADAKLAEKVLDLLEKGFGNENAEVKKEPMEKQIKQEKEDPENGENCKNLSWSKNLMQCFVLFYVLQLTQQTALWPKQIN